MEQWTTAAPLVCLEKEKTERDKDRYTILHGTKNSLMTLEAILSGAGRPHAYRSLALQVPYVFGFQLFQGKTYWKWHFWNPILYYVESNMNPSKRNSGTRKFKWAESLLANRRQDRIDVPYSKARAAFDVWSGWPVACLKFEKGRRCTVPLPMSGRKCERYGERCPNQAGSKNFEYKNGKIQRCFILAIER